MTVSVLIAVAAHGFIGFGLNNGFVVVCSLAILVFIMYVFQSTKLDSFSHKGEQGVRFRARTCSLHHASRGLAAARKSRVRFASSPLSLTRFTGCICIDFNRLINELYVFISLCAAVMIVERDKGVCNFIVGLLFLPLRNILSGGDAQREGRVFYLFGSLLLVAYLVLYRLYE